MLRARRAKGTYEAIFKGYRRGYFKFASRNFYSEFLAARYVAKNYRQYFGHLKLDKPLAGHEILLEGYLSVKDLARHFDVDIAVIRAFNPSLRPPVYADQKYLPKGYMLRLPAEAGVTRDSLLAGWPRHLYKPKQKRSLFYRVQRGDTAGEIAETHGIRLSDLVLANSLDYRARIYVGQNLRLPAPGEKPTRLAMVKKTTDNDNRSVQRKTPGTKQQPKSKPQERSLQKVDIAVSPEKSIVDKIPVNPAVLSGNLTVQEVKTLNGKPLGTIQVMAEETLGHYADWLGVATQKIRNLNGFRYGRPLRLSEAVKIPLDKTSKEVFEEKRFEYHKEIEEDFFDAYEIENFEKYKIRSGDSIWTVSNKFETPLWLIIKYNPDVDFNKLRPMQKIVVPVIAEKETQSDKMRTKPG
jgi:membrane-bound lytic murein transglycosylase D